MRKNPPYTDPLFFIKQWEEKEGKYPDTKKENPQSPKKEEPKPKSSHTE
jgi:hypothetical protein